jgi:flavin-dependent dehydrogenase
MRSATSVMLGLLGSPGPVRPALLDVCQVGDRRKARSSAGYDRPPSRPARNQGATAAGQPVGVLTNPSYDVVIVGGRCAGAATALLLSRAGYRVLVLERAKPGADTLSTLYIHQPGVARLAAWGVLERVVATGCPPLEHARYQVGDVVVRGRGPEVDGRRAAYAPRRYLLDAILAEAAAEAGADVRHGCTVLALSGDERVCGVRYRAADGEVRTVGSRLVVGADGMRSMVARLVQAPEYLGHPKLSCAYYAYWSGVPAGFEQYQAPGRWVGVIPTNDDQVLVAGYARQAEFDGLRARAAEGYRDIVRETAPDLAGRLAGGQLTGRVLGTGDQRNFLRRATGPGWVLVGDAGHHKDSLTARGITDAFLAAQLLADRLGPAGEKPLEAGLAEFERDRDDLLRRNYLATVAVARLDVEPQRLRTLRRIQESAELSDRYFAAAAGVIPPEELLGDLPSAAPEPTPEVVS